MSLYDAYAGVRLRGGTIGIRGGQMWLNDLGGLGSVGGGMVEFAQRKRPGGGRWRAALFGGFEPRIQEVGYVNNVTKVGGLVAYDGAGMRRHVVGFVHIRDQGLTERSVLSFTNYLPLGKQVFVYQAAEYDLAGPGIPSTGALTYFFANGRVRRQPLDRVAGPLSPRTLHRLAVDRPRPARRPRRSIRRRSTACGSSR